MSNSLRIIIGTKDIRTDMATDGTTPVITPLIQSGRSSIHARKNTCWVRKVMLEIAPTTAVGIAQKTIKAITKRRGSRVPNYTLPPHHAQVRPNHLSGIEADVPWGHVERQVMSNCSEVSIIISPKISCILKAEHTRLVRQLRIRLPVELNKHGGHQFGIALAVLLLELFDFRG